MEAFIKKKTDRNTASVIPLPTIYTVLRFISVCGSRADYLKTTGRFFITSEEGCVKCFSLPLKIMCRICLKNVKVELNLKSKW